MTAAHGPTTSSRDGNTLFSHRIRSGWSLIWSSAVFAEMRELSKMQNLVGQVNEAIASVTRLFHSASVEGSNGENPKAMAVARFWSMIEQSMRSDNMSWQTMVRHVELIVNRNYAQLAIEMGTGDDVKNVQPRPTNAPVPAADTTGRSQYGCHDETTQCRCPDISAPPAAAAGSVPLKANGDVAARVVYERKSKIHEKE